MILLHKFLAFGCAGLLMECVFTGLYSLFQKNWRLTCTTYLYMIPIYGLTCILLDAIHRLTINHSILAAFCYVPIIYMVEFGSGWTLRKLVGRCPWDYSGHRFSVMGLIRLDYAGFWFIAGLLFNPIADLLQKILVIFYPG